jgi:hypothetical protein
MESRSCTHNSIQLNCCFIIYHLQQDFRVLFELSRDFAQHTQKFSTVICYEMCKTNFLSRRSLVWFANPSSGPLQLKQQRGDQAQDQKTQSHSSYLRSTSCTRAGVLRSLFSDNIALHPEAVVRCIVAHSPDKHTKRFPLADEQSVISIGVGRRITVVDCVA